jgi:hypothetical protein
MSPSEFVVRMAAADKRFERALKCDDIREMRAALAEKTELLDTFFAKARSRADTAEANPQSRAAL